MRYVNEIIIHCSATRPNWWKGFSSEEKVGEIRRWHVEERGWSDIGYHFVIDRDGTVVEGRPLWRTGAHVSGHNKGTIGVCLLGGHGASADDGFYDNFTEEQDKSLRGLIGDLVAKYPEITKLSGHNNYANKGCPGYQVEEWWDADR